MACNLCDCKEYKKRDGSVRDNGSLEIYECINCGLVYLSSFEHINKEFYEELNMHKNIDFKKWQNETFDDDKRRFSFLKNILTNKSVLDFGSGAGGFLNLAKEVTTYCCAVELEKAVYEHYEVNVIPYVSNLEDVKNKYDVITAFHVIEHLLDPKEILVKMSNLLNKNGKIIIEVPNANDALLSLYKNEEFSNFTYWSCHLYLYTQYTLHLLAKQAGLKVDFIKHVQRYPLSNHLYWLSKGKSGGHNKWGSFLDSKELSKAYEEQLASLCMTDTIIAQFSKDNI
jgi:2-polyprenyl-3-methyl-5-hydroxy-6-metoxy-1,4-benzoquinol methylase